MSRAYRKLRLSSFEESNAGSLACAEKLPQQEGFTEVPLRHRPVRYLQIAIAVLCGFFLGPQAIAEVMANDDVPFQFHPQPRQKLLIAQSSKGFAGAQSRLQELMGRADELRASCQQEASPCRQQQELQRVDTEIQNVRREISQHIQTTFGSMGNGDEPVQAQETTRQKLKVDEKHESRRKTVRELSAKEVAQNLISAIDKEDYAEAVPYMEELARRGNADAAYNLGVFHLKGKGVPMNPAKGFSIIKEVAESGHSQAQGLLGSLYFDGRGVSRDRQAALFWWRKAADQGVEVAREFLQEYDRPGSSEQPTGIGQFYGQDAADYMDYWSSYAQDFRKAWQGDPEAQEKFQDKLRAGSSSMARESAYAAGQEARGRLLREDRERRWKDYSNESRSKADEAWVEGDYPRQRYWEREAEKYEPPYSPD